MQDIKTAKTNSVERSVVIDCTIQRAAFKHTFEGGKRTRFLFKQPQ